MRDSSERVMEDCSEGVRRDSRASRILTIDRPGSKGSPLLDISLRIAKFAIEF